MSAPHDPSRTIELLARKEGGRVHLCAPRVGEFAPAVVAHAVLVPGAVAGHLTILGRAHRLVVPAGAEGRVASGRVVARAVGYGDVLFELEPIAAGGATTAQHAASAATDGALCVRAPHAGRFWTRPAPGAAVFAPPGAELVPGSAVGLIEVMKTFSQVAYRQGGPLPPRASVVRMLVEDGAEVEEDTPLVEVEPA